MAIISRLPGLRNKTGPRSTRSGANSRGNFDGETGGSGPVTSGVFQYPEYKDLSWNNPSGRLAGDTRFRGRIWMLYDVFRTNNHSLNASLLQNYTGGRYYSALSGAVNTRSYVTNPGYAQPPRNQTYYFSGRGEFKADDITSTDIALNYSFKLGRFEAFVQPQMLNVLNEDGAVVVNSDVQLLAPFNPFTETPVEGVHWRKGPNFGKPTSEANLQRSREFLVSFGVRWNPF